ncbi:MAG: molybdopterin molybdotransferase MoeA [Algoriphagus sp.]|uniref:molybdopterin molybdotransferase MoeA n=1 Tax=Algoriphagus sp. TaxID=1872435 RepID=UPI0026371AD2|nr:molybdopterin molybdotransferase MoeA [Algoriphagus sp.]MDG1276251.1 molybdopterin molybdotransferase MoeA [Algoriphagus sp.]
MISVTEALSLIDQNTSKLEVVSQPIQTVLGSTLGADVYAPISLPPFRQSSMDGYAFIHTGLTDLEIIGESKAGDSVEISLLKNQTVRIFTGARVPDLADTVVMQEHVEKTENGIRILKMPERFANVRPIGEQIEKGSLALHEGIKINAPLIGFLAGFGLTLVPVIAKPRVSIIVTGNEIQSLDQPLSVGKIYESNSLMIQQAIENMGIPVHQIIQCRDDQNATIEAISKGLESDILIVSGGISVGDYDFVEEALLSNGVKQIFYKVNQKPGKPLWYGKKGEKQVFALPGNPASTMMCFLIYVAPALRKMISGLPIQMNFQKGILKKAVENKFGKALFLLSTEENGEIEVLQKQASSMLISFAMANAILFFPPDQLEIRKGESVSFLPINR